MIVCDDGSLVLTKSPTVDIDIAPGVDEESLPEFEVSNIARCESSSFRPIKVSWFRSCIASIVVAILYIRWMDMWQPQPRDLFYINSITN